MNDAEYDEYENKKKQEFFTKLIFFLIVLEKMYMRKRKKICL